MGFLEDAQRGIDTLARVNPVQAVADKISHAATEGIADAAKKYAPNSEIGRNADEIKRANDARLLDQEKASKDAEGYRDMILKLTGAPPGVAKVGKLVDGLPSSGTSAEGANMPNNPNTGHEHSGTAIGDLIRVPETILESLFNGVAGLFKGTR